MLVEKETVEKRMADYFEGLLNVEEDRVGNSIAIGKENGVKVLRRLNNT